ncbi:MAG: hypothetical protein JKY56_07565 [Kofleriaceae bacterium]|nr:hypothetical protein [Kofleriaceae bacterium]
MWRPSELVIACDSIPELGLSGVLSCVEGATPSSNPACLVDSCLGGLPSLTATLSCISGVTGVVLD